MPSEIANQIVNHIFGDEKQKALDAAHDAMAANAYDAIQAQKLEFAKTHGFNPDDTAQGVADELEDKIGAQDVQDVDTSGMRLPSDPDPQDPPEETVAAVDEPTEEPKEDETDS